MVCPTSRSRRLSAVPETQPIRVNPRADGLAPIRTVTNPNAEPLPRLDVSLAGNETSSAAAALIHDGSQPRQKTRVQLPQPGAPAPAEETHHFSPDDFIAPAGAPPEQELPASTAPPQAPAEPEFVAPQEYQSASPAPVEPPREGFALPEPEEMSLPDRPPTVWSLNFAKRRLQESIEETDRRRRNEVWRSAFRGIV